GQAAEYLNQDREPSHEMRCGHVKCLQNCRERIQAPRQLGEAMLHEAVADDQTQWDRGPMRDRRSADQINGKFAPHWRPSLDPAYRVHTQSPLCLSAFTAGPYEVKETTLDSKT